MDEDKIKEIIYHSDDLGAAPNMTSRIIQAWKDGLIDGFSVFANGDNLDEIRRALELNRNRNAKIAVHLNLWEGKSLLPPSDIPRLVDSDGYFKTSFLGILRHYMIGSKVEKKRILDEVEREWRAQIKKVIDTVKPRPITAVDGHIHIHMLPFLFRVATYLAKEYEIPEIRIVHEPFYFSDKFSECLSKLFLINIIKHVVLKMCVPQDLRIAKKGGIKYPDAMIGVLYSGMMSKENVESGIRAAERRGVKRLEIVMHIGRAAESDLARWKGDRKKASFVLSPCRDNEYANLIRLKKGDR